MVSGRGEDGERERGVQAAAAAEVGVGETEKGMSKVDYVPQCC
jgi:hypothetical protein